MRFPPKVSLKGGNITSKSLEPIGMIVSLYFRLTPETLSDDAIFIANLGDLFDAFDGFIVGSLMIDFFSINSHIKP